MKSVKVFAVLSVIVLVAVFGVFRWPQSGLAGDRVPGHYIVVFKDNVSDAEVAANEVAQKRGLSLSYTYGHALKGFAAQLNNDQLAAVKNDSRVAFVGEDRVVTAFVRGEKGPGGSGGIANPTQVLPTGVDRINAENKANKGAGVNVAVLDTGIDTSHPDLQANIAGGKSCLRGLNYKDGYGHGTHVAGIIAALDNSIGVVGIAPQAKLWAVRVLDNSGFGTWSSVICGVDFVTSKAPANGGPIKVVNMSLGGTGSSDGNCGDVNGDALHKAICRSVAAGVTYVVAAGNGSADLKDFVPAAYEEVIAASALVDSDGNSCGVGSATSYGADDMFASFSNFATRALDLARLIGAPGVSIRSTWKGGGYNTISGTSMAAPHVSGAAALYVATHPGATPASVRDALRSAGEPANVSFNNECVSGSSHIDPSGSHPEPILRADTL